MLVKAPPLQNETERSGMKTAAHATISNSDLNLFARIPCVKMSRLMFIVIHRNHDSKETAYLRHC